MYLRICFSNCERRYHTKIFFFIFVGPRRVARFRMSKGSVRRAASRLFKLWTLKTQPQPPKDTVRTLKIQRAACYSRVSGYLSAHLAHVKNRFCQRVARFRICKGWIYSTITGPAPGRLTFVWIPDWYQFIPKLSFLKVLYEWRCRPVSHIFRR